MPEEYLKEMKELLQEEYPLLLASYQEPPTQAIRINTSKVSVDEFLSLSLFPVQKLAFTSDGFLHSESKIGNHPYHQAGLFYAQEPSAMLPVNVLVWKDDWKVLDLCAAPGGKTTAIANRVPNGFVLANEVHYGRAKKLLSNVERLGLSNVLITSNSAYEIAQVIQGYFDVVYVDAPCSGEGMFRKDREARASWSLEKVAQLVLVQKELLEQAHRTLKENGYLVYSTCTFSLEENEQVLEQFLQKYNYELVEVPKTILAVTRPGKGKFGKARRCYPYLVGEGQFVAVLKKKQMEPYRMETIDLRLPTQAENRLMQPYLALFQQNFPVRVYRDNFVISPFERIPKLTILACFVKLGSMERNRFCPHHQFVRVYGTLCQNQLCLTQTDPRLLAYLRGEEIRGVDFDGYGVVCLYQYPLGLGKASHGVLKNHYPKGLRLEF